MDADPADVLVADLDFAGMDRDADLKASSATASIRLKEQGSALAGASNVATNG